VFDLAKNARAPVFLILNKIDLMKRMRLLPIIDEFSKKGNFAEIVPVSAATGENVDRLERVIIDRLPKGDPLYPPDYLTDQLERSSPEKTRREKLPQFTRDEIPFSSAVVVERFEDTPTQPGSIVVDRESQKPIIVGRAGAMIKQIGTAARRSERFFHTKVPGPARAGEGRVARGRQRPERSGAVVRCSPYH
jgi:GTP-binding protein Era